MMVSKRWISFFSVVLACVMVFGCVVAEEEAPQRLLLPDDLPQMVKVTFADDIEYEAPAKPENNYKANQSNFSEDNMSYHDDSLDVQVHMIRAYDTPIAVVFVQIADPQQLRTEQAKKYPSKATMRIDTMGKRVNAVVAINADWFTYHNDGIIYRNGERLRNRADETYDGLAIDVNGDFHIVRPMIEEEYAKITTPIWQSFAFGPALVMDGEVLEIVNRKVTYKQRCAIGQIAPLSYVLVATDGPDQPDSFGLSVPQLAELMHALGAHTAYNLDGGQSTSMLMNMVKINGQAPKTMRAIGDIIYFTTAIPSEE
ncbi:MAG: phosphodiester glycosidase family protein [Clostridiales bacterium]|nr:phosphodiester glycosidase family protein [Clostridiales bacterium]